MTAFRRQKWRAACQMMESRTEFQADSNKCWSSSGGNWWEELQRIELFASPEALCKGFRKRRNYRWKQRAFELSVALSNRFSVFSPELSGTIVIVPGAWGHFLLTQCGLLRPIIFHHRPTFEQMVGLKPNWHVFSSLINTLLLEIK